jgi:hypothetical protein
MQTSTESQPSQESHLSQRLHGTLRKRVAQLVSAALSVAVGASLLLSSPARAESLEMDEKAYLEDEKPPEPVKSVRPSLYEASLVVDIGAHFGVGRAALTEDDFPRADLTLGVFDGKLGVGTFVNRHVKLGYELTLGDRQVIGDVEAANTPGLASGRATIEGGAWYLLPLGAYLELYPTQHLGLFLGLHAGAGTFFAPEYMSQGNIHLAGSAAIELGYDLPLSDQSRGAVVLRYSATGFKGIYIDEAYNDKLTSNELSLAARVSLF